MNPSWQIQIGLLAKLTEKEAKVEEFLHKGKGNEASGTRGSPHPSGIRLRA